MLKSELVISEDLKLLESYLKHYSIRFLGNIFSDDKGPDIGGYKEERIKMIAMIATNHHAEARSQLIPQMISERDLLTKVGDIIWNKSKNNKWDIDPVTLVNILNQIGTLKEIIEKCCASDQLTKEMLNEYYEESILLLIYFNIVRSYIITTRNIFNKFQPDNIVCILKFNHTLEISFSIIQQKIIVFFIEAIFSRFFADYMDIIAVEFDTGSPKLDCSIKMSHESKETWDKTKSFSDFFNYLFKGDMAGSIRAHKKISNLLYQDQKRELNLIKSMKNELTQEEYKKRVLESFDSFSELRRNNILVAVDNSRYKQIKMAEIKTYKSLEGTTLLQIEDSSPPLLPDKT